MSEIVNLHGHHSCKRLYVEIQRVGFIKVKVNNHWLDPDQPRALTKNTVITVVIDPTNLRNFSNIGKEPGKGTKSNKRGGRTPADAAKCIFLQFRFTYSDPLNAPVFPPAFLSHRVPCRHLGSGAFADVWLFLNREEPTLKVAKIIRKRPELAKVEASILKTLVDENGERHPNIVEMTGAFCEPGQEMWLELGYLDGGNLLQFVHEQPDGRLTEEMAQTFHCQMISAQVMLHTRRTRNNDYKPPNVMITGNPKRAVMCDFGLADCLEAGFFTVPGGTPNYSPPEKQAHQACGLGTDLWSIGLTTKFMLTGIESPYIRPNGSDNEIATHYSSWIVTFARDLGCAGVSKNACRHVCGLVQFHVSERTTLAEAIIDDWVVDAPHVSILAGMTYDPRKLAAVGLDVLIPKESSISTAQDEDPSDEEQNTPYATTMTGVRLPDLSDNGLFTFLHAVLTLPGIGSDVPEVPSGATTLHSLLRTGSSCISGQDGDMRDDVACWAFLQDLITGAQGDPPAHVASHTPKTLLGVKSVGSSGQEVDVPDILPSGVSATRAARVQGSAASPSSLVKASKQGDSSLQLFEDGGPVISSAPQDSIRHAVPSETTGGPEPVKRKRIDRSAGKSSMLTPIPFKKTRPMDNY